VIRNVNVSKTHWVLIIVLLGAFTVSSVFAAPPLDHEFVLDLSTEPNGSVNNTSGTATVRGTVTCNEFAHGDVSAHVRQRRGKDVVEGSAFQFFQCNGKTPWTVTIRAGQAFKGGRAEVIAFASGCGTHTCDSDLEERIIKLSAKK
jgi:hypothetical protein